MASSVCWRCLPRPSIEQISLAFARTTVGPLKAASAFSTTTTLQKVVAVKSTKGKQGNTVKRGQKPVGFIRKKKKRKVDASASKHNAPKAGERKNARRRIVLSNTNALSVPMPELTEGAALDTGSIGSVMAIPDQLIDRLRASAAFRKTQAWGFFRKPAMLIRKETVELAEEMNSIGNKHIGRVLTGDRGSGKSLHLLQAQAIAHQLGWTVISFPEAQYIADGSTDYRPAPNTRPVVYEQPQYTSQLQRRIAVSNPSLGGLPLAIKHSLPVPVRSDSTVNDLALLGARTQEHSIAIFDALMKELTAPGRPPILIVLDGLAHVMRESAYRSPQFEPIHAHDLVLVQWFMKHLSGATTLPNGGLVLAATSASNEPKIETLRFRLHQLEIKQALEKGLPNPRQDAELPDPVLPFLLATGQQPNPVPQPDRHANFDERVLSVLGSPHGVAAGNKTANAKEVQVQNLKGLSKDEARGIMEYWAKSGVMRQTIDERLVSEKWSLAGGGIVGELERGCFKFRL